MRRANREILQGALCNARGGQPNGVRALYPFGCRGLGTADRVTRPLGASRGGESLSRLGA